jgi:hypothetical protein
MGQTPGSQFPESEEARNAKVFSQQNPLVHTMTMTVHNIPNLDYAFE